MERALLERCPNTLLRRRAAEAIKVCGWNVFFCREFWILRSDRSVVEMLIEVCADV
jgi:hypothetical protein